MSAEPSREFRSTSRFEVVRALGRGGMGLVYEALDRERGERVAIKTIRAMSPEALLRFKNEFRALVDIHHANLVTLGEMFEERGEWFFTMELLEGVSLIEYVRPHEAKREEADDTAAVERASWRAIAARTVEGDAGFDEARLRDAFGQLARGLAALHGAGKVHRDVKPSNVIVTASGRVKVLDFGVIADSKVAGIAGEEFVGTHAFMAPEQARAESVGPAADWYAVGVVLYQALTGARPFSDAAGDVLALKQLVVPLPARSRNRRVPPDLDRLCADLLRTEPGDRPTGADVLKRLGVTTTSHAPPRRADDTTPFVGRTGELATLKSAFDAVAEGGTITVLLHGESGVGKSALARRFLDALAGEKRGAFALSGRCYERESLPYKAVDAIVDALSRSIGEDDADVAEIPAEDRALLARVFPVLARLPAFANADAGAAGELGSPALRAKLFAAVRALFVKLGARRPLVLLVDDLQWADADSLALLAAVLRPQDAPRMLLVATLRSPAVEAIAAALPGEARTIALRGLPEDDARALVGQLLDAEPDSGAVAIAREAAGHPLFIDALVRARRAGGTTTATKLDDALWSRVQALDAPARALLELLAVAGGPLAHRTAANAVGESIADVTKHIAVLKSANLARSSGARPTDPLETYHDRVREAVVARLDEPRRRDTHQRLAHALEAAPDADAEALATHWLGAGDRAKAHAYTVRAAERAAEALAFERAARLYAQAIDLAPSDADTTLLRVLLGDALASAGHGANAARAYLDAAAKSDPAAALELRRRAAEQLLRVGQLDEALDAFRTVLAAVGMEMPKTPRSALVSLVFRRAQLRLRGLGFRPREASAIAHEDLVRIDACWMVGIGLGLIDMIIGAHFQTRGLLHALAAGEPSRIARALAGEACFSAAAGGPTHARTAALLESARELAAKHGDPYTMAWPTCARGVAATLEGRWREGHTACDEAARDFRRARSGVAWEIGTMRWFSICSLAFEGNLAELAKRVPAGIAEARARNDLYAEICHTVGWANLVWLAADAPGEAQTRIDEVMGRWSQQRFCVEHWWAIQAAGHVALYEGRGLDALRMLDAEWKRLADSLLLRCQLTQFEARIHRARAAIAASIESPSDARDLLKRAERDIAWIAGERMPWADPVAALLRAGIADARGDRDAAVRDLGPAIAGFDAQGMELFATSARERMAALVGGPEGEALRARTAAWWSAAGVKRSAGMVAMMAPGFRG